MNAEKTAENPIKKRRVFKPYKHLKTVCGTPIPPDLKKSLRTLRKRLSEMENKGIHPLRPVSSLKGCFIVIYYFVLCYLRHGISSIIHRLILYYVLFAVLVDSRVLTMNDIMDKISTNNYSLIQRHVLSLANKHGFLEVYKKKEIRLSYSVYPSTYLLRCLEELLKEID